MTFSHLKKLEFHDHLDGSLRPLTVWEEARKNGVNIACLTGEIHPTPESTEKWLKSAAASRNLNSFLEKFALTTAVLQTEESLFRAAREHGVNTVTAGGGVAANGYLRELLTERAEREKKTLILPEKRYCTDNACMIAAEGYIQYLKGNFADLTLNAKASIPLKNALNNLH